MRKHEPEAALYPESLYEIDPVLAYDYVGGKCSQKYIDVVNKLKHLPVNGALLKDALENPLPPPDPLRVARMMNAVKERGAYLNTTPHPEKKSPPTPKKLAAGQIWSIDNFLTGAPGKEYLPIAQIQYIFILTNPIKLSEVLGTTQRVVDDTFVEFLPVSLNVEFADQHDMIMPAGNASLGVEFMIQTEINSTILCSNLQKCFGEVEKEDLERLINLMCFTYKMGFEKELLGHTPTGSQRYSKLSHIVKYKKTQYANSQILREGFDDLLSWLSALEMEAK